MSRQESILYTPENPMESRRHATISAAYPGAILPMSSRPKFLAPPSVAIFRASCAPMAGQTHSNHTVVQYHAACLLCHMLLVTYAPAITCSKHVSFAGGVYGPCNALCRDSPVAAPVGAIHAHAHVDPGVQQLPHGRNACGQTTMVWGGSKGLESGGSES